MSLWHRLTSLFRTLLRQGALERDLGDAPAWRAAHIDPNLSLRAE